MSHAPAVLAAASLLGIGLVTVTPAVPAYAVSRICGGDEPAATATGASLPLERLRVGDAQSLLERRGVEPGQGVRVAVVDSGVRRGPELDVVGGTRFSQQSGIIDYHGTAVAGLIAGAERGPDRLVGVAPAAGIVDVRVYDASDPADSDEDPVTTARLIRGLDWVADEVRSGRQRIGVVNVSLAVLPDPALERAVERLWRADVVVVAASGNRPEEGELLFDDFGAFRTGEDAAKRVFPAGYPHVVAVNATADDLEGGIAGDDAPVDVRQYVLQNTATDLAAPTAGGITVAVNGGTCELPDVATSWAAAEVSGVVALLRSAYPRDSAAQIVARLRNTADGLPGVANPLTGAGVVQPVEALTRPLEPDRTDGSVERAAVAGAPDLAATAPTPDPDVLAGTRGNAVWWGLLGGGALLLALVLRPVLMRRRG